jgi:hypothetical protein
MISYLSIVVDISKPYTYSTVAVATADNDFWRFSSGATFATGDAEIGDVAGTFTRYMKSVDSSLDEQRINTASEDHTVTGSVEKVRLEENHFMNKFLLKSDGWVCGDEGELLLWILRVHRPYFHRSNTVWIAGKHDTKLQLANFVHGSNWATVYNLSK